MSEPVIRRWTYGPGNLREEHNAVVAEIKRLQAEVESRRQRLREVERGLHRVLTILVHGEAAVERAGQNEDPFVAAARFQARHREARTAEAADKVTAKEEN